MKKLMSLLSRRELLRSIIQRYRAASRKDKQRILDEFVEATGCHRKYAVALLHKTDESPLATERTGNVIDVEQPAIGPIMDPPKIDPLVEMELTGGDGRIRRG